MVADRTGSVEDGAIGSSFIISLSIFFLPLLLLVLVRFPSSVCQVPYLERNFLVSIFIPRNSCLKELPNCRLRFFRELLQFWKRDAWFTCLGIGVICPKALRPCDTPWLYLALRLGRGYERRYQMKLLAFFVHCKQDRRNHFSTSL